MNLYMFRTVPLSIIRSFSLCTRQWFMSLKFSDSLRTESGWIFVILGMKSYMFWTVPLSIIRSFSLYTQKWCMSYRFADSLPAGSGLNAVPSWSCSHCCVQRKTPDDGQRNCPKHVDFQSKNKLKKLVRLVGSIVRKPLSMLTLLRIGMTSESE